MACVTRVTLASFNCLALRGETEGCNKSDSKKKILMSDMFSIIIMTSSGVSLWLT